MIVSDFCFSYHLQTQAWDCGAGMINIINQYADLFTVAAMRVEWAKTKARADRWHEEVLLVSEEMRRVLYFFQWKAEWWSSQSALRMDAPIRVQRGIAAYAAKQVAISHAMATSFAGLFCSPFRSIY